MSTQKRKYDLSKIMSDAHKLYKNAKSKYPRFSDALRKAWSMEKFNVKVKEGRKSIDEANRMREAAEKERREQAAINSVIMNAKLEANRIMREAEAKADRMRMEIEARKAGMSYESYLKKISLSMGYGNGSYCED